MGLYRLIYTSTVNTLEHGGLQNVVESMAYENDRNFITGMLLMDNGYFVQLLEGERAAVSQRFIEIAAEPYHRGVEIMVCEPIDARLFSSWEARYVAKRGQSALFLKRYQGGETFNPYKLTAANAQRLCLDLAMEFSDAENKLTFGKSENVELKIPATTS